MFTYLLIDHVVTKQMYFHVVTMLGLICYLFIILHYFTLIGCYYQENNMNVGTVLFTESDLSKKCWSKYDIALLTSRMILENLVPVKSPLFVNGDEYAEELIGYFRLMLQVVRTNTKGQSRHLMLLALSDILGGYLRHMILPSARYHYYEGKLSFNSMQSLNNLYDELKLFLRTNAVGWSLPIKFKGRDQSVKAIQITPPEPKTNPCKGLVFNKNIKGYAEDNNLNVAKHKQDCMITVPMPFFDSKKHPTAIAVPFHMYSLRNIESQSAAYVLLKFYVASVKCLVYKNASSTSLQLYNKNLQSFLKHQVLPHLQDEKFYSAFGGVLRIIENLRGKSDLIGGTLIGNEEKHVIQEIDALKVQDNETETGEDATSWEGDKSKRSSLIITALLMTLFIWFLLGSIFICYRIKASRNKCDGKCDEEPTKLGQALNEGKREDEATFVTEYQVFKNESKTEGRFPNVVKSGTSGKMGILRKDSQSPSDESDDDSQGSINKNALTHGYSELLKQSRLHKSSERRSNDKKTGFYPATYACHSSLTGRYKMGTSSEEILNNGVESKPLVFGYEFETSSSESGDVSETENYCGGNSSK